MKKRFYILSFLLLQTTLLLAAEVNFTATASKSQVGVGEQFEVDFTVNATGNRFTPPDFSQFQVISGPNITPNTIVVNGVTVAGATYGYILSAAKEGTFTITAAAIVINGHTLLSNSLKIIVKGQAPPVQKSPPPPAAAHDEKPADNPKDLSKSLFIRAEVNKTKVYTGEQLNVRYKLYTRVDLLASQLDKAPDLNGFWSQDVLRKSPQV